MAPRSINERRLALVPIANYDIYTNGMRKSMADKLWFLNKIKGAEAIVDYGCADGSLIGCMADATHCSFDFAGLDIDNEMLDRARGRYPFAQFVRPEQVGSLEVNVERACLNCSSVIHEVYSYNSAKDISRFWNFVFDTGFQYITIRDMAVSRADLAKMAPGFSSIVDRICSDEEVRKRFEEFLLPSRRVRGAVGIKEVVHFLLKYRYVDNWERELQENYLPLYKEDIVALIPKDKYRIRYMEHYTLPFLKEKILEDFGIEFNVKTHYKILLEKI